MGIPSVPTCLAKRELRDIISPWSRLFLINKRKLSHFLRRRICGFHVTLGVVFFAQMLFGSCFCLPRETRPPAQNENIYQVEELKEGTKRAEPRYDNGLNSKTFSGVRARVSMKKIVCARLPLVKVGLEAKKWSIFRIIFKRTAAFRPALRPKRLDLAPI